MRFSLVLWRQSAVGEDEFATFCREEMNRGEACEVFSALFAEGEKKDALGMAPGLAEFVVGAEDG